MKDTKAPALTPELVAELVTLQQEAERFLSTQQSYTKVIYAAFRRALPDAGWAALRDEGPSS